MSTYAPDFLQIGLASDSPDSCIGSSFVLSRRIGSAAVVVVLSSDRAPLRASCIGAVNSRLHEASSVDPQTIATALVDGLDADAAGSPAMSVLTVDDASRTATVGARGHSLWIRRGPLLQRLGDRETRYRPGDVIFVTDGAPFADSQRVLGLESMPVLTGRRSTARLAQSFLRAALAAGSSSAEPVRSVVAIRVRSRDDVLFRRRLGTALAASLAAHFLLTTALHWLPGPREAEKRRVEQDKVVAIVTISSAHRTSRRAVARHDGARRAAPSAKPVPALKQAMADTPVSRPVAPPPKPAPLLAKPARTKKARAADVVADVGIPSAAARVRDQAYRAAASRTSAAQAAHFTDAQLAAVQARLADAAGSAKPGDPLIVPSEPPAASKRYAMDMTGTPGRLVHGEGILRPLRSWQHDGYVYYYVTYEITYSDGTYESGDVPWPIRYLPENDPFTRPPHVIPLPVPLPDFVLPPGTQLGRALRPYFPEPSNQTE
jgi:hypothetical protein